MCTANVDGATPLFGRIPRATPLVMSRHYPLPRGVYAGARPDATAGTGE